MKETTNYNLKKIELTDSPPDITVLNNNWDTIDEELKSQADALATKETPTGAQTKANTAEANAKAYTDAHEQKAAPHSGHETPAGAQAKANTAEANAKAYTDAHEQKAAPHSGHETPAGAQAKANAALNSAKQYTDQEVGGVSQALAAHQENNASTSKKGHVQLTDSVSSTSTTTAATPNSVKQAYDKANAALPRTGGTMTGILTAQSNTSYTVRQVRNIILSTASADVDAMQNGDIWIKYRD